MAAGWNTNLIVETWSSGVSIAVSIGLAIAAHHTGGKHICIVPDRQSRLNYLNAVGTAVAAGEVMVGEPEEILGSLKGIDFMVVDCQRDDLIKTFRSARLADRGAVLVCKNVSSQSGFRWRTILNLDSGSHRRLVRSVSLPVGKGLDIAHISSVESSSANKRSRNWITHVDRSSGEETVIRR